MAIKKELLEALRRCHDMIKEHPFRQEMNTRYCKSYKDALYDLSEIWASIIYDTKFETKEEERKYRQFGGWIHNYRARLQMYYPYTFPMVFMDYYEQMLQLTHEYLDTGYMDRYYILDKCFNSKGEEVWVTEKYEWITENTFNIKSSILPRYMPVKWKLVDDEQEIYNCINSGYNAYKYPIEQINEWFEFWKTETKPIINKLNEKTSTFYKHMPYESAIYTPVNKED